MSFKAPQSPAKYRIYKTKPETASKGTHNKLIPVYHDFSPLKNLRYNPYALQGNGLSYTNTTLQFPIAPTYNYPTQHPQRSQVSPSPNSETLVNLKFDTQSSKNIQNPYHITKSHAVVQSNLFTLDENARGGASNGNRISYSYSDSINRSNSEHTQNKLGRIFENSPADRNTNCSTSNGNRISYFCSDSQNCSNSENTQNKLGHIFQNSPADRNTNCSASNGNKLSYFCSDSKNCSNSEHTQNNPGRIFENSPADRNTNCSASNVNIIPHLCSDSENRSNSEHIQNKSEHVFGNSPANQSTSCSSTGMDDMSPEDRQLWNGLIDLVTCNIKYLEQESEQNIQSEQNSSRISKANLTGVTEQADMRISDTTNKMATKVAVRERYRVDERPNCDCVGSSFGSHLHADSPGNLYHSGQKGEVKQKSEAIDPDDISTDGTRRKLEHYLRVLLEVDTDRCGKTQNEKQPERSSSCNPRKVPTIGAGEPVNLIEIRDARGKRFLIAEHNYKRICEVYRRKRRSQEAFTQRDMVLDEKLPNKDASVELDEGDLKLLLPSDEGQEQASFREGDCEVDSVQTQRQSENDTIQSGIKKPDAESPGYGFECSICSDRFATSELLLKHKLRERHSLYFSE